MRSPIEKKEIGWDHLITSRHVEIRCCEHTDFFQIFDQRAIARSREKQKKAEPERRRKAGPRLRGRETTRETMMQGASARAVRPGVAAGPRRARVVGKATFSKRVTKMGDTQVIMSIANGAALALGRWGFLPYQRRKVEEAGLPTQNGDTHLEAGLKEDFASSKLSQVSSSFQGRAVWNTDGAKKKAAGAEP